MDDPSKTFLTALGQHTDELTVIIICLFGLAFSSLAEAALMRVELGRIRQLVSEGRRGSHSLEKLFERRQELLASLVLLINFSVIAASAYTTSITIHLSGGSNRWVPVTSLAMIAFILVICEVTPKTYGLQRAEAVALFIAPIFSLIHQVLCPITQVFHVIAIWFIRHVLGPVVGGKVTYAWPSYSDEEVIELVSEGQAAGEIEQEEREMIQGIIEFSDKIAREVMTPRTDMVCVPAEISLAEAARISQENGHSRLPVYEENVDHIIGILNAKDMVSALQTTGPNLTAGEVARKPPSFAPESKKLDELLPFMQRNRLHMVILIDEYGGTAGLVTMEDLLSDIFGEIQDEFDMEEELQRIDETTLVVDGRVSTDKLEDELGISLPEGGFDSVGGFILDQLGHLPEVGEIVVWKNFELHIEAVSENRIQRIRIIRTSGDTLSSTPPDEKELNERPSD